MKVEERIRPGAIWSAREPDTVRMRIPLALRETAASPPLSRESPENTIASLQRQLRRLVERNAQAFDQGFAAAIALVQGGASVDRLREASGVVSCEFGDTLPVELLDVDDSDTMPMDMTGHVAHVVS